MARLDGSPRVNRVSRRYDAIAPLAVIRLVADLLIGGQTARDLTENQMPVRTIYETFMPRWIQTRANYDLAA